MSDVDRLLRDPDTARCWREVVTREDPMTLDGVAACYGRSDSLSRRAFEASELSDDELYARLGERLGVKPSASDPGSERVEPAFADPSDQAWDTYMRDALGLTRETERTG